MARRRQLRMTDWLTSEPIMTPVCDAHHACEVAVINDNDSGGEQAAVDWPDGVTRVQACMNPSSVAFLDVLSDSGRCECTGACLRGLCANAAAGIFCNGASCGAGDGCGNRCEELTCLELVRTQTGIGLSTILPLPPDTCVGEYCGVLLRGAAFTPSMRRYGYAFEFAERDIKGEHVFVDASRYGNLCRFINHSCLPNCRIEVMVNGSERKVAVVTTEFVPADGELTFQYCAQVWFVCRCVACVGPRPSG